MNREQAMFTFLNSTLSPAILALIVGQKFANEVWKVLEKRFASVSRSYVMSLRIELNAIKKGTDSIDGYFKRIKQVRDKLPAMSVFMDDEELLHIALDGLTLEYDSFSSTIRTQSDVLSIEELNTLLNAEERVIKTTVDPNSIAMAANFQSQDFSRGRGVVVVILILEAVALIPVLSFRISINLSHLAIRGSHNLIGQPVKSMVKMVTWLLTVIIIWILHAREGILMLNLHPWWLMLLRFKPQILGSQTQVAQIMSLQICLNCLAISN
ncbi:hypothetical protein SO802_017617 [Lithocarpus litseifolius]|uniref:Retrotransposon gag domain-containing protein n=1 Tax=Lithocarpus litseifolius TaxID=425828 RepID=A0AAW2CMV5_9ROSI